MPDKNLPNSAKFDLSEYGLRPGDWARYVRLLTRDMFTVEEAACVIYPIPLERYEAASTGDDGRMDRLERRILDAMAARRLKASGRGRSLRIKDVDLLDWAKRRRLLDARLASEFQKIVRSKMAYSGRMIPALENRAEVLGAGMAVLAETLRVRGVRVTATKLRQDIERVQSKFWPNDEGPPLREQGMERLLSSYLKALRKR